MTAPTGSDPDDGAERWAQWDETLADGDAGAPEGPPPGAASPWIVEQRFVHGLLRAWHTADAAGREARVQGILAAVERDAALGDTEAPANPFHPRQHGADVGGGTGFQRLGRVAAVLAVAVALWFGVRWWRGADALPLAEAVVARAIDRIQEPVDRVFAVEFSRRGGPSDRTRKARVTVRPGRFLMQAESPIGPLSLGCDGDNLWFKLDNGRLPGRSVPLSEARRMESMLEGILELGYLDLENLLARLPQDFRLTTTGREERPEGDRIRVAATSLPERLEGRVETATLWFEEATGMVSEIRLVTLPTSGGERRLDVVYEGTTELPAAAYRMP